MDILKIRIINAKFVVIYVKTACIIKITVFHAIWLKIKYLVIISAFVKMDIIQTHNTTAKYVLPIAYSVNILLPIVLAVKWRERY